MVKENVRADIKFSVPALFDVIFLTCSKYPVWHCRFKKSCGTLSHKFSQQLCQFKTKTSMSAMDISEAVAEICAGGKLNFP